MLLKTIALDYLIEAEEGQFLDRKSARIKPSDIARHLVAFANSSGGILVIGVEDDNEVTGFEYPEAKNINEFLEIPYKACVGNIKFSSEVKKAEINGKEKSVLLFLVEPSDDSLIKTTDSKVYLRVGDKSKLLTHEQVTQLEYDKGERSFEDIVAYDSNMDDIDTVVLEQYKDALNTSLSFQNILEARGLLKEGHLTYAGILLFAKYPTKFLPNARLRLLRYDGVKMETGARLNLVKELCFEGCIPKIIQEIKSSVNLQLREFQYLDENGVFKLIPEYPEFAWFEGVVNSLTHRNYAIKGDHIRVSLYDDRLEIFSPGKLPNIVTLDNMFETRYSRNPRIARVLSEFGWVKELNEGVKRIYDEMQMYFLKSPTYSEPNNNSVLLVLENSMTSRQLRGYDKLSIIFKKEMLDSLNEYELSVIQFLVTNNQITIKSAINLLRRGEYFSRKQLKALESKGFVVWHGSSAKDPTQYYMLKTNN